jgi:hypothetical protein
MCFVELAKLRLSRGEDTLALVQEAKELEPDNLLLHWIEARGLVVAGRHGDALPIFRHLARVDPDTLLADVLRPADFRGLGVC